MHLRLTNIAALKNQPAVVGLATTWPLATAITLDGGMDGRGDRYQTRFNSTVHGPGDCVVLQHPFGQDNLWLSLGFAHRPAGHLARRYR
jgi:hypothetical protein